MLNFVHAHKLFGVQKMSLLETWHCLSRILSTVQSWFTDNQLPTSIYRKVDAVHTYILDDVLDGRGHLVDGERYSREGGMLKEVVGEERREVAGHRSNDDCWKSITHHCEYEGAYKGR